MMIIYFQGCFREAVNWATINSTIFFVVSLCFAICLVSIVQFIVEGVKVEERNITFVNFFFF